MCATGPVYSYLYLNYFAKEIKNSLQLLWKQPAEKRLKGASEGSRVVEVSVSIVCAVTDLVLRLRTSLACQKISQ